MEKGISMRIAIAGLCLLLCSCCPQTATIDSARATWAVIGPEYTAYVTADPVISEATKTTRLRTAELFTKLLAEGEVKP